MTAEQILAYVQMAEVLAGAVQNAVAQLKGWFQALHGRVMTDDELNVILDGVKDDATRRKLIAQADALGTSGV